ncbi:putative mads box protein [Capsicum annuum]|uniref:immune-associated nucleotide-binding protein 9 n=1 Tax=Capsicum annuum TaxID=4072 RepID=UPI001FB0E3F1|nr:immune-associated nucleotide-binding protein 9 [Capsicum annuum]XP_016556349.2 immune-associated nucleotide-binding protein 9 [Capsicum annuum]KAF3684017.1 putative mads box protein [Capsicum annuum]
MGGSAILSDDWEFATNEARTVVLIGRAGDGKSSTGNTILGRKVFRSMPHSAGVTTTCEVQRTQLPNGQILDVIDTPGLFDFSGDSETVGNEIVKCIDLAKDGIHGVLLVLSVRSRFTREQQAAVESFQHFFGNKISDYMVVVFTGGDDLEDNDVTLDDYLTDRPEPLQEILAMCQNRHVLFDNRSKDPIKKADQLKELLEQVSLVVEMNGGKPYTNDIFKKLKDEAVNFNDQKATVDSSARHSEQEKKELQDVMHRSHEEQIRRIQEMVESKLRETMQRLEKQLEEERAARLAGAQDAKEAQQKSKDQTRELKDLLESSRKETEEAREKSENETRELKHQLDDARRETKELREKGCNIL